MRLHPRGWTSYRVVALFILFAALGAGCGGGAGGGGGNSDWYYHWDCHGDTECLSLNPTGASAGTLNEGPVQVNCTQLMEFASRFWNIPPATNSCDHSPTPPPPVPTVATFVPTSGIQGTPVTLSGGGFPAQVADITVSLGGVDAVVTSVTSNQVVFKVPALAPGSYRITVTTAGGSATTSGSFTVRNPVLTVNVSGTGSVVSAPAGISCSSGTGTCSASFPFGSAIGLTESHAASAMFDGWMGGGCSGTGSTCAVTLDADITVTASFVSETLTLFVTGNGTVVSSPAGINCGDRSRGGPTACSAAFLPGSTVTLTETPGTAASFGGWSGGTCAGTSSTCTLTLDSSVTVNAPFLTYTLTVLPVAVNGTAGTGTITSVPAGIACVGVGAGATGCTAQFAGGTQVTLTAVPPGGSSFAGWVGAGCSGSAPCVLTLDANTTVTGQYCVPHATLVFATPGTSTVVACADTISVEAWGAGGGGGGGAGTMIGNGGSGGGGGGYGTASVTVTTGSTYTLTVGAGGSKGIGYHNWPYGETATPGGAGGSSGFDSLLSATGGGGGSLGNATGGAGGTSAATANVAGSPGQVGTTAYPYGGGAGGAGGNGGAGGAGGLGVPIDTQPPAGSSPNGTAGTPPGGGGGGGGWQNYYTYDGAAGGDGKVIISW